MSASLFDRHSRLCPICHHSVSLNSGQNVKKIKGLYVCPHCQARTIVCWSGHYVCDPSTLEKLTNCPSPRSPMSPPENGGMKHARVYAIAIAIGAIALGILSVCVDGISLPEVRFGPIIEDNAK